MRSVLHNELNDVVNKDYFQCIGSFVDEKLYLAR